MAGAAVSRDGHDDPVNNHMDMPAGRMLAAAGEAPTGLGELVGGVLPHAVGIAVSPVPVIAVVLLLMSPRARVAAPLFACGWVVGVGVLAVAGLALSSVTTGDAFVGTGASLARIGLGGLLLTLAVRSLRRSGGDAALPGWMQAVDRLPLTRVFALALALAALNPKNLGLGLAAADALAAPQASVAVTAVGGIVFVVVGSLSVGVPVLLHLASPGRTATPLRLLKSWLITYNTVVVGTLLVVLGVVLLGQGISGL